MKRYKLQLYVDGLWQYEKSTGYRTLAEAKWAADKVARTPGRSPVRVADTHSGEARYTPVVGDWEKQARADLEVTRTKLDAALERLGKEVDKRYQLLSAVRKLGLWDQLEATAGELWSEYKRYDDSPTGDKNS